jgi:glutamyl-Q tRNA(Asp) synthetase
LVCALASFLHAKQAGGKWLVRIEDIDTPRIAPAISPIILRSLFAHGMQWDDQVVYQSERHALYEQSLDTLAATASIYGCKCSRKDIQLRADYYDNHCRELGLPLASHAVRWKNPAQSNTFTDLHFKEHQVDERMANEDPVLKRTDGIYNYHLAVVTDDIAQNITHIVRGADLIDTSILHMGLFNALDAKPPTYLHIPLAVDESGQKLSKQQHAAAIDDRFALSNLKSALRFLGANTEQFNSISQVEALIDWAIRHWQVELLPSQTEILVLQTNNVYCIDNL